MKRILFFIIIIMSFQIVKAETSDYEIPQVLIIQSYHSGFLWSDNIDTAIKTSLKKYNHNIRIKTEFLDTKRFNNQDFKDNLKMMLEYKYKDSHFDLIITADNNAFELVKELHKSIFKEAPLVFCGLNYFHPSQLEGMNNVTGVREKIISLENFQLIKSIHKNVKKIIVLNEMTPTGKENRINILADMREFKEDVEIEIVEDVSIEELKELLANLDQDTIVLYSLFFKDNQGAFLEYDESALLVAKYSAVPVYVSIDFSLGYGAVGGYLTSGRLQGENAANLAIQILEGAEAEKLDIIDVSPNGYYFDYKVMQKWGISIKDVPENSVFINYQESYFQSHKDIILRFAVIVLILSLIIFWLIITLVKKNRLKNELMNSYQKLSDLKENLEIMVDERTKELQSEEKKYRSVYENTGIAMITVAEDGIVTMVNDKFVELSGYTKEEIINKLTWKAFIDKADMDKMQANRDGRYNNELPKIDTYEVKLVNKKGFVIDALLNVVLVPETREIISSITDISQKNAVQNKMQLLLEEQKAFNEAKRKFYSNFGKDLNTPLKSIYGLVDFLEYTSENNEDEDTYKIVKNLTSQLLYIVNEMTEFQIESAPEAFPIQEVYLPELLQYILEFFTERTNINEMYYRVDSDLRKQTYLAVKQLEKLLEIIIIKLAKFDPSIPILIDVAMSADDLLRFTIVSWQGTIAREYIKVENKKQEDIHDLSMISELRFNYLVINKLVDQLGGKIEYASDINPDKEFIFTIKNYSEKELSDSPSDSSDMNSIERYILPNEVGKNSLDLTNKLLPLKLLLVNYSNINHQILYKISQVLNQKVQICAPDQDLKEILLKDTFDVIFIDLTIASINDLESLQEIKEMENINKPYIVADIDDNKDGKVFDTIDAVFPDILSIASFAFILESALEYKNRERL